MTQPTAYTPSTFFAGTEAGTATAQLGVNLSAEFENIEQTTDEIRTSLAAIQRDDGALANDTVGVDQLDDTALALMSNFSLRGEWQAGVAYMVGDMVADSGSLYLTVIDHTAGVLATDVAAGKMVGPLLTGSTGPEASAAEIRAGTVDGKLVSPAGLAAAAEPVDVASAATITLDMQDGMNFHIVLDHDATLANFLNALPGYHSGYVRIEQGATGGTMNYASRFIWPAGAQNLSVGVGKVDFITYSVTGAGEIVAFIGKDLRDT